MLSTTSSAPASWASAAIAAMSAMLSSGLVGVSIQTSLVAGRSAAAHRVEVVDRRRGVVQAPVLRDLVEQPVGAAVGVVRDDHVVARPADRRAAGCPRPPARRRRRARAAAPPAPPGKSPARCGSGCPTAVLVAAAQLADAVLLVGRGRVDRRTTAPVCGSGSWPAWIARVSNPDLLRCSPCCSLTGATVVRGHAVGRVGVGVAPGREPPDSPSSSCWPSARPPSWWPSCSSTG